MTSKQSPAADDIAAIRRFSRFYTRQLGLLAESMHASPYSLSEARVLYELAHGRDITASDLIRELGLDAGYLSRMLKRFEEQGLIRRAPAEDDARRAVIALTAKGQKAYAPLDRASEAGVTAMLENVSPADRTRLVAATKTVRRLLGDAPAAEPYILRGLETGDAGWITHRQAVIYAQEYGWTSPLFEALVAEILSKFITNFDPAKERAWIAERDGEVVGSVFIARGPSPYVAQLRLLYVDPSARGLGLGRRLVDECIRFSRAKGYKTLMLWTHDILVTAVRIYEAAGFKLIREERHNEFGHDVNGQFWEMGL